MSSARMAEETAKRGVWHPVFSSGQVTGPTSHFFLANGHRRLGFHSLSGVPAEGLATNKSTT
jgi:hypothetical protein